MKRAFAPLLQVLKCLLLSMALFSLCRLLFLLFNYTYFSTIGIGEIIKLFLAGWRFDISAILMVQGIFILASLVPIFNKENTYYQKFLKILFGIANAIALLLNCIDFSYFKFTLKRTTAEIFYTQNDIGNLLPQYLKDYWYILFLWLALVYVSNLFYPKLRIDGANKLTFWRRFALELSILIFAIPLGILGIRGGFQVKPLRVISAAEYTVAQNIPLVINTPFSVIKSIDAAVLSDFNYFNAEEAEKLASFQHPAKAGEMNQQNVVLIILESFSKEYIGFYNNGKGYTPFLDSLMRQSLVFENAFANGKKSIEGIPAVLAGIPSLMDNPYLTSIYGSNQFKGIGTLLSEKNYNCSFYHGGINGTMGFDAFTKLAGFNHYYGRTEYNNENDFDGNWGIYDEPFYHYFVQQLNKEKTPFCAAFFSLSSHHPYSIPTKLKGNFPKGTLEIHESIGYADYALRKFFSEAAKTNWFSNTLFIITSDHTSISEIPFYQGKVGSYAIPLVFYKGDKSLQGKSKTTVQQIDVMPSILDQVNYNAPYFAYGNSVFDSLANHYAINYNNGIYQYLQADFSLFFDGERATEFYNYKTDSLLSNNLSAKNISPKSTMEKNLKAFLQNYNHSLIHNKMSVTATKK